MTTQRAVQQPTDAFCHTLIGLDRLEAETLIKFSGFISRVISVNGRGIMTTNEKLQNRINLVIVDDLITDTYIG